MKKYPMLMYAGAGLSMTQAIGIARKVTHPAVALIVLGALLAFPGCSRSKMTASMEGERSKIAPGGAEQQEPERRFLAIRHKVEILAPDSGLSKAWESVIAFCGTIRCEVVSSSITANTGDTTPSGSMMLRVATEDIRQLLTQLEKQGKIAQHTTETEDKTAIVADTDARIKNLSSFRDSLRAMLAKPSGNIKDVLEVQRQLTDVQSQLDSQTTQRKILANETDKIAVEITFRSADRGAGFFAPIGEALHESASLLANSLAALITVVVALLPWLVVIVPAWWLLARWLRKRRQRRALPAAPSPS